MVSALRAVVLLGLLGLVQANDGNWTSPADCDRGCLRTTTKTERETETCTTTKTEKETETCTVTITAPGQTYYVTQNFTATRTATEIEPTTKYKNITVDISKTITTTYDIYRTVIKNYTTTEEETTTVTDVSSITLDFTSTDTDTITDTVTATVTDVSSTTLDFTSTDTDTITDTVTATATFSTSVDHTVTKTQISVSESDIYVNVTVPTTISATVTATTEEEIFITATTTVVSLATSIVTTSYPVTVMEYNYTTITDLITAPPVTLTSTITQVSWVTTILTTTYSTTATQIVPTYISVTKTAHDTSTETDVTTLTLPVSTVTKQVLGSLTTVTLPASTVISKVPIPTTVTLPGIISLQTITKTLPGIVSTITVAGVVTTTTLPGLLSTLTKTVTLPGQITTLPGAVVTVTQRASVVTCPHPTPTFTPAVKPPVDYTWGCAPGFVCVPPKPIGCDVFEGPPPDDYVCQQSECIPAPKVTKPPGWGPDVNSNLTSYYPPQPDYFNLSPFAFGLSYDIFAEDVVTIFITGPDGIQTPTQITTGNWASQASETLQPTPYSVKKAKRAILPKRALFRRDANTVPAMCFNECNSCYLEAQMLGKTPELCSTNPPSSFQSDYQGCDACVVAHGDTTKGSLKAYVYPQFQQFLSFCQSSAAVSEVAAPTTPVQSEVSVAPVQTVVSQSQAPPASVTTVAPVLPITTSTTSTTAQASTPPPPATTSTSSSTTSSTSTNSTSSALPKTTTTSATSSQITGGSATLRPATTFSLVLTVILMAVTLLFAV